jgi:hypothetical protein
MLWGLELLTPRTFILRLIVVAWPSPGWGWGQSFQIRPRIRMKQLTSLHARSQIIPELLEKMMQRPISCNQHGLMLLLMPWLEDVASMRGWCSMTMMMNFCRTSWSLQQDCRRPNLVPRMEEILRRLVAQWVRRWWAGWWGGPMSTFRYNTCLCSVWWR